MRDEIYWISSIINWVAKISESINLQMDQQQLRSVVSSLESTLAQQIFWVSSNKPINLSWFSTFPDQAVAEFPKFLNSTGQMKIC